MPVRLRQFTFLRINDFYEKEKEEYEKANGQPTSIENLPRGPGVMPKPPSGKVPSYTTKARKQ